MNPRTDALEPLRYVNPTQGGVAFGAFGGMSHVAGV